ncbi:hypothetical protein K438DRAFT_620715 [Mycena galopus ATCC 62051]|nr:hypothetical protein K438DRAFT_620715 [Mycena galopus ATCC 62051]
MPSTLSSPEPQRSSSWWSVSPKSPPSSQVFAQKSHSHSKQSGIKFNTLATAMGFKPKKSHHPPPLTLDHPYSPVATPPAVHLVPRSDSGPRRPYTAPSAGNGIGRAPSTSVSSTRSRGDSIGPTTPRTPEDPVHSRRGSLLTLSDADPFAARVVSLQSPSDPNRLSAFSNSSAHDIKSNESANRVSYASSSSSFRMGGDRSPQSSIVSPVSDAGSSYMKLPNKLSGPSLRRKDEQWLSGLGSDPNRLSEPAPLPKPRPAMRARGMTDGGIERTNFLRNDPFMGRTPSPKFPPRQVSLSRPAPPPNQELPPPPSPVNFADDRAPALGSMSAGSASSSSLTFSAEFSPISPRSRGKQQAYEPSPKSQVYEPSPKSQVYDPPPKAAMESGWEPDTRSPRTLKKSISHQSLGKQRSPSTSAVPLPDAAPKEPRKQRSFTQHRLPVPPVPLQLSFSEQRTAAPDPPTVSTRKRLFSASSSRRPSQSTLAIPDDVRSLHTADQEITASTSCWIDTDPPPRSSTSTNREYTPQQIMSPAEMLQVEASVEAAYQRPRTGSIMSASTGMSDFENDLGLSPISSFGGGRQRSNSDHPSMRSTTTSEGGMYTYNQPLPPQPPSPPILMSLPPPPRRTKSRTSSLSRSQSEVVSPLSPAPRTRNLRPKISVEERMHRRSILRKPSFLDIDDEYDKEDLPPQPKSVPRQASFLDLTRASFDSGRSSVHSLDYDYN